MSGGTEIQACFSDLCEEFNRVMELSDSDDKEDKDGDGVVDVKQVNHTELVQRKLLLVASTVDPDKVTNALAGLYQGFLSILMTVKFEFAQTIALAMSIAENARKPFAWALTPFLIKVLPPDSEVGD